MSENVVSLSCDHRTKGKWTKNQANRRETDAVGVRVLLMHFLSYSVVVRVGCALSGGFDGTAAQLALY